MKNGIAPQLADERVIANVVSMLNGSTKNEAAIVSFGLQQLAEQPEIQMNLFKEIQAEFGDSLPPSKSHLLSLKYLTAVTQELLRLKPGFPVLSKIVERRTSLGGYRLGVGCEVAVRLRSLQMHPKYWQQPNEFLPERHLGSASRERSQYVYIPFGIGRRSCPGKMVAQVGIAATLCQIIQNFEVSLPDNSSQPKPLISLAIGYDAPIRLNFTARDSVSVDSHENAEAVTVS